MPSLIRFRRPPAEYTRAARSFLFIVASETLPFLVLVIIQSVRNCVNCGRNNAVFLLAFLRLFVNVIVPNKYLGQTRKLNLLP